MYFYVNFGILHNGIKHLLMSQIIMVCQSCVRKTVVLKLLNIEINLANNIRIKHMVIKIKYIYVRIRNN